MSVWVTDSCVYSPLGTSSEQHYALLKKGISALAPLYNSALSDKPLYASLFSDLIADDGFSRFETMCLRAMSELKTISSLDPDRTLFILSTTKGNVALLRNADEDPENVTLHYSARRLAEHAGLHHWLVISNACISGVMAIIVAKRYLDAGKYDHAVVIGADELSHFIVSGFLSLNALSSDHCRPFDAQRTGINLGEAAAGLVLSTFAPGKNTAPQIRITGGGLSNDANHISGPSRTGDELAMAVRQALEEAELAANGIDFISAHGTATVYNDEMEAKAFTSLGMNKVPLNSLKGYFGHTLGAAGVVESVMSIQSLLHDEILATAGFEQTGSATAVNVSAGIKQAKLTTCLKTASGFGGCNAAIVIKKEK